MIAELNIMIWNQDVSIYNNIFIIKFSNDNGRVTLKVEGGKICKVKIAAITYADRGIWKFTIGSGMAQNNDFVEYSHNVSVKDPG